MRIFQILFFAIILLVACKATDKDVSAMLSAKLEPRVLNVAYHTDSSYVDTMYMGFTGDIVFERYETTSSDDELLHNYIGFQFRNDTMSKIEVLVDAVSDTIMRVYKNNQRFAFKKYDTIGDYKIPYYGWGAKGINMKPIAADFYTKDYGYLCSIGKRRNVELFDPGDKELARIAALLIADKSFYNWKFPDRFIVNKFPREY